MRKLVAVYGSLKKGQYNHDGLGQDAEHLGNMTVRGVMYSNGSYPKLYKPVCNNGKNFVLEGERDHAVEVYSLNENRYKSITNMEVGAGYEPEDINTPYGPATLYWMPHSRFNEYDHWVEAYPSAVKSPLEALA